jgi:serine/threonine-protein kinase
VGASLLLVAVLSLAAWRGLVRPLRALLAAQREAAGGPAAGGEPRSETAELHHALAELERRAAERHALDEIFLGRYQVMAHLGSGGMGSVYRGWDPRLQRTVALKTIQISGELGEEEGAKKLLAEAVAVAQITHPHVVAVYDAEQTGGAAFVAMELVEGLGLDKYLEKRGRLDWREVVPLGAALTDGLAAAHARGLVHRDIKPGNVLLGHDGAIKIADFGLATFLSRIHEAPGKVFGTPGFLAPEALQGKPIDERSDLYAAGVVLFRALSGRYPVRGTSFQQIVVATVRDPAPQPFDLELEGVPPAVAELVCGLLAKEPDERLAPAGEAAKRFAAIAHEHQLTWRLDFGVAAPEEGPPALSAAIPTLRLDADLA